MIKPSLSKNLLAIFSVFVLLESLLIGILCFDVMAMNEAAHRELEIVQLSQDINHAMNLFQRELDALADLRNNPDSRDVALQVKARREEFEAALQAEAMKIKSFGFDPAAVDKLSESCRRVFDLWDLHYSSKSKKKKIKVERTERLFQCANQFAVQLKFVQKLSTKAQEPVFGLAPAQLLHLTALINLFYLVFAVAFVERSISRPLARLTEDCEKIRKREPLAASRIMSSEIGTLQESFQQMAGKVVENEKRRKSYLELIQSVQLKSLSYAQEKIRTLSASSSLLEKAIARLKKTLSSVDSLSALLKSMSEQLEQGSNEKLDLRLAPCGSAQLIQQNVDSMESLLQSRGIKLEFDAKQDLRFNADPEKLSRVLLNLLSNAVKYSPDGGTVKVDVSANPERVRFAVQDSGPGINEEGRSRLFKRFAQLEALDGIKRAGTGLGLVICRELVEAHGGEIGCISAPGQGSTFWFELPQNLESGQMVPPAKSSTPNRASLEKGSLKSLKTDLAFILAFFVLVQSYLFFELNGLFADSSARNVFFQKQKKTVLEMEDYWITFVRWSARLQVAALKMDLSSISVLTPKLSAERTKLLAFKEQFDKDGLTYKRLSGIVDEQATLLRQLHWVSDNISEVMQNMSEVKDSIEVPVHNVEDYWKTLLLAEHDGFKASYDFSEQVRNKILALLVLAAAADFLLICSAAYLGLKLAGKILVLKSKAESFAAGQRITFSLEGRDELSFLDQRLCQVAGEIQDAEAKRQELLAVINHDLRTPLTSVIGTMDNLRQGVFGSLSASDAVLADESRRELENLLTQINNLLLLEKVESHSYEPSLQDYQLKDLLDAAIASLSAEIDDKHLKVLVEYGNCSGLTMRTDKELVSRSLLALLKNAVSASPAGGELRISVCRSTSELQIKLSNSGQTIDERLMPQLFERFRFIDGVPVSGLGLSMAQQCLRLLGASLDVFSEGKQTVVTVNFSSTQQ